MASDSTHVRAFDQNILTEWHSRYHGRGVLIYWHVERKSMAVHSQLIACSASEVAAMVEGAMRHDTTMDLQANYTANGVMGGSSYVSPWSPLLMLLRGGGLCRQLYEAPAGMRMPRPWSRPPSRSAMASLIASSA